RLRPSASRTGSSSRLRPSASRTGSSSRLRPSASRTGSSSRLRPSASRTGSSSRLRPSASRTGSTFLRFVPPTLWASLDRCFSSFTRADAHGLFDGTDEDLPVPNSSRLCALFDGVEHVVHELVRDDDLDLYLWHEVDDVRGPPVDLFLTAGSPEAFHLGDGHALHAHLAEGVLHLVEFERLDDGLDLLHWGSRAVGVFVFVQLPLALAAPSDTQVGDLPSAFLLLSCSLPVSEMFRYSEET